MNHISRVCPTRPSKPKKVYPAGADYWLNASRDFVLKSQLFSPADFAGVTIRWCSLRRDVDGMTPDRDVVCISDGYFRQPDAIKIAVTLAHEMVHVRQYRSRGTDNF